MTAQFPTFRIVRGTLDRFVILVPLIAYVALVIIVILIILITLDIFVILVTLVTLTTSVTIITLIALVVTVAVVARIVSYANNDSVRLLAIDKNCLGKLLLETSSLGFHTRVSLISILHY